MNYASTTNIEEVMKFYNLDDKTFETDFSLNLSASYGGKYLNLVYRHPSQLSVPEVPTTVPPQLQPYWLKI